MKRYTKDVTQIHICEALLPAMLHCNPAPCAAWAPAGRLGGGAAVVRERDRPSPQVQSPVSRAHLGAATQGSSTSNRTGELHCLPGLGERPGGGDHTMDFREAVHHLLDAAGSAGEMPVTAKQGAKESSECYRGTAATSLHGWQRLAFSAL
ncbi:hypothetical protein NDU88_004476 [Pleurodeles waltl]|uniref:Uncharacterized protein n=1 Tax=Pleurodeles waltl TaxID=8319 RepID=A0AAV7QFZ6_PLEWA|nr:hypothetical protein NDU88_004476 [Pleurodeles waltl]